MRKISRIIFVLTAAAVVTASFTISTVDFYRGISTREEKPTYETPVPTECPTLVESCTEPAETLLPVVNSPVNNVQNPAPVEPEPEPEPAYLAEHLEILAIIIYQEAGGDACSDDTRLKVGSVFLNRVASPLFPNTFEEVATAERQYGTLHWTGIKWPDRAKYDIEAHAVDRAYALAEELLINGSILPPNVIWQSEHKQGDGVYCQQDGFYFCYSEVK